MKFNTYFSEHKVYYSNPGSPVKIEYQLQIVGDNKELVATGKHSLYDYIQSHADSVDIHKILERCALLDDYSILNRMPTRFMDVVDAPKNLAEAAAMTQEAENFFDRMPLEIKEKYDNNFIQFLQDIGSDNFLSNVASYLDSLSAKEESLKVGDDNES